MMCIRTLVGNQVPCLQYSHISLVAEANFKFDLVLILNSRITLTSYKSFSCMTLGLAQCPGLAQWVAESTFG